MAEISQWCITSKSRLGYPEDSRCLSLADKEKYKSQKVTDFAEWIPDLNPALVSALRKCWSIQPLRRTPYSVLLRELETAKFSAREKDSTLCLNLPANPPIIISKVMKYTSVTAV